MVIIGSFVDLKIGGRYVGLHYGHDEYPAQPYVVVRRATVEEYLAAFKEVFGDLPHSRRHLRADATFYEIELD